MNSLDLLLWLQGLAAPWQDTLMGGLTYLGSEYFYLAALGFLYWCVDAGGTMRLFVILLFSTYLNSVLKELVGSPRPFQAHPELIWPRSTETAWDTPAFPSNHAQGSTIFWGYLCITLQKRWLYVLAPIAVLTISLSRLYLGLHWPVDVVGGIALGLILLGFSYLLLRLLAGAPLQARFPQTLVLALVPLMFFLIFPWKQAALTMGVLLGGMSGRQIERRYVRFRVRGALWQQAIKLLIGLGGTLLLLFGLNALLAPTAPVEQAGAAAGPVILSQGGFWQDRWAESPRFGQSIVIGLWATLIAPAIFRLLFGPEEEGHAAV